MNKEIISNKQAITMMTMFIMGSTLVLGVGSDAKQDVWIAILVAIIFAVPAMAVYSRILSLFPGKNLFEILNTVFGKITGKAIAVLYIWFAFHLGALVLTNFYQFIKVVSFPETPQFVPIMLMGILCIWVVKEGIEVLGRWSQFAILLLVFIIFSVVTLNLTMADFDNLRPVLYDGIKPVFNSAFSTFSFPFAETVLFLAVFNLAKDKNKPYKIYFTALLFGGFIVLLIAVRNILVMGSNFVGTLYFPAYSVVSLIEIGDFLQRIEVAVSVVFLYAGFVKISVCLLAACKGMDSLLQLGNYRQIVAPVGFLMMIFSCNIYDNIMEMQEWAFKVYKFYAFPFQVLLPIIIWIAAEIKIRNITRANI